ncbi:hypothetical protein HDU93_002874, partial [Gonapodya sp. JEL0774]
MDIVGSLEGRIKEVVAEASFLGKKLREAAQAVIGTAETPSIENLNMIKVSETQLEELRAAGQTVTKLQDTERRLLAEFSSAVRKMRAMADAKEHDRSVAQHREAELAEEISLLKRHVISKDTELESKMNEIQNLEAELEATRTRAVDLEAEIERTQATRGISENDISPPRDLRAGAEVAQVLFSQLDLLKADTLQFTGMPLKPMGSLRDVRDASDLETLKIAIREYIKLYVAAIEKQIRDQKQSYESTLRSLETELADTKRKLSEAHNKLNAANQDLRDHFSSFMKKIGRSKSRRRSTRPGITNQGISEGNDADIEATGTRDVDIEFENDGGGYEDDENEVMELQHRVKFLTEDLTRERDAQRELKDRVSGLEDEIAHGHEKLRALEDEVKAAQEKLLMETERNEALISQLEKHADEKARADSFAAKIVVLEAQLKSETDRSSASSARVDLIQKQLHTEREQNAELLRSVEQLEQQLRLMSTAVPEAERKLEMANETIQRLTIDIGNEREQISTLRSQVRVLEMETEDHPRLREELTMERKENGALRAQLHEAESNPGIRVVMGEESNRLRSPEHSRSPVRSRMSTFGREAVVENPGREANLINDPKAEMDNVRQQLDEYESVMKEVARSLEQLGNEREERVGLAQEVREKLRLLSMKTSRQRSSRQLSHRARSELGGGIISGRQDSSRGRDERDNERQRKRSHSMRPEVGSSREYASDSSRILTSDSSPGRSSSIRPDPMDEREEVRHGGRRH